MSDSPNEQKYSLLGAEIWLRLAFMVIFALALKLAIVALTAFVVVQFIIVLFTGAVNKSLLAVSKSTSEFVLQSWLFLSFASEEKPFPFRDWPS
ncbi:MAG: DUF4389 domain-containing protein [Cellvibrionaceae bacterium]|nr:DUF4389 domain-containing protein [Cellvibrionaceae bacterium]